MNWVVQQAILPAHTEHFVFAGLIVDPHVGDIGNAVGERGNHATGLQRRPSADVPCDVAKG